MPKGMNIIGISAFYHDAACCLLRDGRLVSAAAEERFTRIKHDAGLPIRAFRFCLDSNGLDITDIDCIAFYEDPAKKWDRQKWSEAEISGNSPVLNGGPKQVERIFRERLGYEGPVVFFDHHLSHAASAFYYSGFEEAAILTVDGVGEWATTSFGFGQGKNLEIFEEVHFPHSLGLFYATITAYLGFRVNKDEYKVMGLAPYGKPRFVQDIKRLIEDMEGGQFRLNLPYFDFIWGKTMFAERLCELLGMPARLPDEALTDFHKDVARSVQQVLEEILLKKIGWLSRQVETPNLCLAGGVALNCVANGRIAREGAFKQVFIQPAAGDDGGSLGAAALAYLQLSGKSPNNKPLSNVFLGPAYSDSEIGQFLRSTGLLYSNFASKEAELMDTVADRLVQHQVIGWFQGAMEFGPRALGARSILANPMGPTVRDRLNNLTKKRESFRPFAPSVLEDHAAQHFQLDHTSPFMMETCNVISPIELPGITHVDGSARPQTVNKTQHPRFAALLEAFYRKTGCPLLLNTSFNIAEEPIVCTPSDALMSMYKLGLDALVLGSFILDRKDLPAAIFPLIAGWRQQPQQMVSNVHQVEGNLYSFV